MPKISSKEAETRKIVDLYINRFKGEPDATRLIVNMLADNVTDVESLLKYIIRHELKGKTGSERSALMEQLAKVYGVSLTKIKELASTK
ncbi:MAG: hypothetical protein KatS3mg031_0480 [Chitinophagales bacterium]|nr:MAG: hypothetical protein KatS3mg031_0480 [Chitinophagales bacterium]